MWSPTHVQVLVKKAKDLNIKGKNGTNDAYVTICLGKEKFQTSVKEKSEAVVEWNEQCELSIPEKGNTADVVLTVLHRSFLGVDEFLGTVSLPLRDFEIYDRPKTKWFNLLCKPGQSKDEYRGELEVRVAFTVKSLNNRENKLGSILELNKKSRKNSMKGSLQSLDKSKVPQFGSLLSLASKEKGNLKKLAKAMTNKVEKAGENLKNSFPVNKNLGFQNSAESNYGRGNLNSHTDKFLQKENERRRPRLKNADPGVNSDDEDDEFRLDALSNRSSVNSLNITHKELGFQNSKASTPLSGSFDSETGSMSHNPFKSSTAKLTNRPYKLTSQVEKTKTLTVLDEWEAKLLGKKVPQVKIENPIERSDSLSLISANFSDTSNHNSTLERRNQQINKKNLQNMSSTDQIRKSHQTKHANIDANNLESSIQTDKIEHHQYEYLPSDVNDSVLLFKEEKDHFSGGEDFSPNDVRVVLGRSTTPTPESMETDDDFKSVLLNPSDWNSNSKVSDEIHASFEGQTREDMIKTILALQATIENQKRGRIDLENYIDVLVAKVIACAPTLLENNFESKKN